MISGLYEHETSGSPLVAMAGNPNVGKTTLFNRLTGADLKVSNYPGVTVEIHTGRLDLSGGRRAHLIDVPGTYSLSARSADEQVAVQAVTGIAPLKMPDLVVVVVDATQLTRNLYLALQIIETGAPVVLALNMTDMLERREQEVDVDALRAALGVPVVPVVGTSGEGVPELEQAIGACLADPGSGRPGWRWQPNDPALLEDIREVGDALPAGWANGHDAGGDHDDRRNALALWALLSLDETDELAGVDPALRQRVLDRRQRADEVQRNIDLEVIRGRYEWIDAHAPEFTRATHEPESAGGRPKATATDRIDDLLLHPLLGFVIFLLLMGTLFQSVFAWADPLMGLIESGFSALAGGVESVMPPGIIRSFLTDALIQGVGSVLVFLPQILLLFFFIGLMEDSGYMARVAFLMDRIMRLLGLHGRAFVPMLSGFACAIPAIMATRTIERRRDRMLTMMVVPLMTCSARLPVYLLVIGALFPPGAVFGLPTQGLLMIAMYLFSTLTALVALAVLSRTLFKGPRVPLILELPAYRLPHWSNVLRMMWQRSALFVKEAGGVILVCTIGLWVLLSFPRDPALDVDYDALRAEVAATATSDELRDERLAVLDSDEAGARLQKSFGGRMGHAIEPLIEPLGFDWKIGVGLIGAFAAREVFVSTMGVVYGIGDDVDEESATLREKIRAETRESGEPVYTPLMGLSLMVFFALACQCMSTLAVVYRETKGWRWPVFLFVYMTGLAWVMSLVVYQGGRLLGYS